MALSDKRQRFVEEYLVDLNATKAAERAGYSKKTANEQGARLLANVSVRDAIEKMKAERAGRVGITLDRVILELSRLAIVDPRGLYDETTGKLKPPKDWTDDQAAAISSIETLEEFEGRGEDRHFVGMTQKVRLWPKGDALKTLLHHLAPPISKVALTDPTGTKPFAITTIEVVLQHDQEPAEAADGSDRGQGPTELPPGPDEGVVE